MCLLSWFSAANHQRAQTNLLGKICNASFTISIRNSQNLWNRPGSVHRWCTVVPVTLESLGVLLKIPSSQMPYQPREVTTVVTWHCIRNAVFEEIYCYYLWHLYIKLLAKSGGGFLLQIKKISFSSCHLWLLLYKWTSTLMSDFGSLSHCSNLYLGVFSIWHFGSLDTSNLESLSLCLLLSIQTILFLLVAHIRKITEEEEI